MSNLPPLVFTDEIKREYPAIFFYAIAGMGKTNTLRTIKHLNPLVLATEDGNTKGMGTLADLHMAAIMISNLDQLVAVTSEIKAKAKPGQVFYNNQGPFGALALDSLTGIGPMLEDAAKKIKGWSMIWDASAGARKDPRSAYPYIAERGRMIIRALMDIPVPLILTCREALITEGEGESAKQFQGPELPGAKLPKELPGWMEASLRLRMVNGKRCFITENEGDIVSRIRLGEGQRCPKYIKPDLGLILRLLSGDATALKELSIDTTVAKTPQQVAAEQRAQSAQPAALPSVAQ